MSHYRLVQPWIILDNPQPREPKEDNIISGIHQHNLISRWEQSCQDSYVKNTKFQPRNAIPCQDLRHPSGDRGSAEQESEQVFWVCSRYPFEYYQLWSTAIRNADSLKICWSVFCQMHKWLAQLSLQLKADLAYPITSRQCSSHYISSCLPNLQGVLVQCRGALELRDVATGTVYIWKRSSRMILWRYANDHQSNYDCQAWNWVQQGAFT